MPIFPPREPALWGELRIRPHWSRPQFTSFTTLMMGRGNMGSVKRVLLGSAAGVFAVAGAQAADLAVKAKPVEYVKVCSLYGAGFWYVPGTDTCIKIGGQVKLQLTYHESSGGPSMLGFSNNGNGSAAGRMTRTDTSPFAFNNRGMASFDLRTQTEYGTLRSYLDMGVDQTGSETSTAGSNAQLASTATAGFLNTRAFLQFAGFTAGRMRSFFDLWFPGTIGFNSGRYSGDTSPNGIVGIAYTWQFGGGLSASVSLEDNSQANSGRGRSTVNLSAANLAVGANTFDNKGVEFFDPVFNLRLDQAWGFVGVSVALHDASGGYYQTGAGTPLETNGHPGDKFGWAVTPAFLVNSPFGMTGDLVAGQVVYSKGAAGYATPAFGPWATYGAGNNVGLGWLSEGVFTTGGNVELTTVWSFNAAYEHRWNPQWRTSAYGGMFGVQYSDAAKAMICGTNAAGVNTFIGFSNF